MRNPGIRKIRRGVKAAPQILVLMVQVRILAAERGVVRESDDDADK
jgi:hypothetical protein